MSVFVSYEEIDSEVCARQLNALIEAGYFEAANHFASWAVQRFSKDYHLLSIWAELPKRLNDLSTRVERWGCIRASHPKEVLGYEGGALALLDADRIDEAEAVVEVGCLLHPQHAPLHRARGIIGVAAKKYDEADKAFEMALSISDRDPICLYQYVRCALLSDKLDLAQDRVNQAMRLYPDDNDIKHAFSEVQARCAETSSLGPHSGTTPLTKFEAINRFESLGGEISGCEFGFVQRHFGLEPLSLLRWVSISPQGLTRMLEVDFAGIDSLENIELFTEPNEAFWRSRDLNFGGVMLTYLEANHTSMAEAKIKICKRLGLLTRRLKEDLQESQKIFVYKSYSFEERATQAREVWRQIRRYGGGCLLWICRSQDEKLSGSVYQADEGLFIGYLKELGVYPTDHQAWREVCEKAILMQSSANSGPEMAALPPATAGAHIPSSQPSASLRQSRSGCPSES